METGTYISGAGHVALLGWLLLGRVFTAEPLPVPVTDVSVISSADFEALRGAVSTVDAPVQVSMPAPVARADPPAAPAPPAATEAPPATEAPAIAALPEPQPAPEAPPELEPAPPPPAERIAPEPVAAPEPDAAPDPAPQEAVQERDDGEREATPQEATAPEEAAPEIVTEAEVPEAAPQASLRPPPRRPEPPRQSAQAETPPAPQDSTADAVAGAVAAALSGAESSAPVGPPLTGGEKEGLRVAVSRCWNVGAFSSEAQETKITVAVEMGRDGTPVTESIRMIASSGGSEAAAKRVFDSARRAIIRCGARGFPLPVEKFAQWRNIEMTFNPEGMFY